MSTTTATSQDLREWQRLRAWDLHEQGWRGKALAETLGISQAPVSGWLTKATVLGSGALHRRPPPGPTPTLTAEQFAALPALL